MHVTTDGCSPKKHHTKTGPKTISMSWYKEHSGALMYFGPTVHAAIDTGATKPPCSATQTWSIPATRSYRAPKKSREMAMMRAELNGSSGRKDAPPVVALAEANANEPRGDSD